MKTISLFFYSFFFLTINVFAQANTEKSYLENAQTAEGKSEYVEAISWYKKATEINPKNIKTYEALVWCQNEEKLYIVVIREIIVKILL